MAKLATFSVLFLGFGLFVSASAYGASQNPVPTVGHSIGNNTPRFTAAAKNMGPLEPWAVIDVSLWLNLHNRSELDALVSELYNPNSPNFRHWMDRADLVAKFAPTAQEVQTVKEFLTANKLTVVAVGPANFFVKARGTVANTEAAFHVAINQFEVKGQIYRGNTSDPYVEGPAGALVGAVYGLDNLSFKHPIVSRNSVSAKHTPPGVKSESTASGPDPFFFTSNCFTGPKTESYPGATYKGNGYNGTENIAGCGYTPADIYDAYNLNGLYREGYDGSGQTIVIVDWCGSPTIRQDANAFSARFGLPALTPSTFKIIDYPTPSTCAAVDPEINIDVEWAHAIAPGAAIDLVVPPTPTFDDVDAAALFAVINQLGSVISGSYGSEEAGTPINILATEDLINEVAAAFGISANFSTGDSGDFTFDFNDPVNYPASVSAPADSPYATAVGGVSLALKSNHTIQFQTGWGTNLNPLIVQGSISDPPTNGYFYGGSGGGPSAVFSKPSFQSILPGKKRQLPDISWLADPYTGAVIAITEPFTFPPITYQVFGGTSLACPMFSALWAIANQEAGFPLGQAAPWLYYMPAGTITDVLPVGSNTNVTATIRDEFGTTTYTAAELAAPLENTTKFYSALWDIPLSQDTTYVLTFGTDSGLTTKVGWDNVTGLGTPNGKAFADAFRF